MWCSTTTTEDWHLILWIYSLYITIESEVWIFADHRKFCSHSPPYANICHLLSCWSSEFYFFVVEMKILKNNAYSIQKLWMGERRCQLYVHYMFWCNPKHWEYVVLCCKNKSISDIAVLLLKIKPLQNRRVKASNVPPRALCWGFLLWAMISCIGAVPNSWLINCWMYYGRKIQRHSYMK